MSKNYELMLSAGKGHELSPSGSISVGSIISPLDRNAIVRTEERQSDVNRVLGVMRRWWRQSAVFAITLFAAVCLATYLMQPLYEPTVSIEFDPPGSEAFSMDRAALASSDTDYVGTQAQNLQGDDLAIAVIRTLHLDQNREFTTRTWFQSAVSLFTRVLRRKSAPGESHPGEIRLTDMENRALLYFQKRLDVTQIGSSRVIQVGFASRDAHSAALTTNTLVNLYVEQYYRTRYDAVMESSRWLSKQLDDLRDKMQKSNDVLAEYQKKTGIADVDDKQSTFSQKLADLNRQLTQAQADRIQFEAYLGRVQAGNENSLPQIRDNAAINALTERAADVRSQLSQAQAVYGENHPNVKKLQSQAEEYQTQVLAQQNRIVESIKTSYTAARAREQLMFNELRGVTEEMAQVARYNLLKKDAQVNTDLYNTLYARIKEAGIAAASKSQNIRVVDQARVLNQPTSPRVLLNILIGFFVAVVGGIALAFVRHNHDESLRSAEDLLKWTGLPALSVVPAIPGIDGHRRLAAWLAALRAPNGNGKSGTASCFMLERPRSIEAEAIRCLETSILMAQPGSPSRVILVASAFPREGKTTLAVNLALSLSQRGRTCLVDADLRRPRVAASFGLSCQQGLANVLCGEVELEKVLVDAPGGTDLKILPVGSILANPGKFATSNAMYTILQRLRKEFSYVVIDASPLLLYADGRMLATLVDGSILVGRCGSTPRQALIRCVQILERLRAPFLGIVLNDADFSSPDYHYYRVADETAGEAIT